jgi:hypothetical protein
MRYYAGVLPRIGRIFKGARVRAPHHLVRAAGGLLSIALGFTLLGSAAYFAASTSALTAASATGASVAGSVTKTTWPTASSTPTWTATPTPTPTWTSTPTPTTTPTDAPPASMTTPTDAPPPSSGQLAETGGFDYPLLLAGLAILGAGLVFLGTLALRPRRRS